jgi:peptidoglycan-associated lipoprotein
MRKKETIMTHFKKSLAICAVTVAALWSAGCTKQQVVKQDQMIPPAAVAAEPVKAPAPVKLEKKEPVVAAAAIDESQAKKQVEPAPVAAESSLKSSLEQVFFDFDSYTLSESARSALAKNAELIRKEGSAKIRIEGHCDELGSDDYNLALGEKRAKAAQRYLESMGVASDQLSTISYGKERPADQGHDDAARAKNRRDEFVVSSK